MNTNDYVENNYNRQERSLNGATLLFGHMYGKIKMKPLLLQQENTIG